MRSAQAIFDEAFAGPRDRRSAPYKAGVLRILRLRLEGVHTTGFPYPEGSAELDAYLAGSDEGHAHARAELERRAEAQRLHRCTEQHPQS